MQYHCWADRRNFLDMTDAEVRAFFLEWIRQADCPWYVLEQYLTDNGARRRGGAGPSEGAARRPATKNTDDAREDIEGWEWPCAEETSEGAPGPWSETEKSSDEGLQQHDREDTHVLSLLYKGNVAERNRQEQRERNTAQHLGKLNFYKNTRCTTIAQEECSALPAGVFNANEDSDDADAYDGEQKEIVTEMEELRAAESWVNQDG